MEPREHGIEASNLTLDKASETVSPYILRVLTFDLSALGLAPKH